MTYSPGGSGYPPVQQHGPYAPTTQFSRVEEGPSKVPVYLLAAVVVLGLAGYAFSFGPVWKSTEMGTMGGSTITGGNFEIVALVFAALLAAVALLPKQRNYTAIVAVIAVVGFLLAISELITKPSFLSVGWALIAIVVAAALQSVAAVAALLLDAGVVTAPAPRPKYDQYPQYGGYYGQPGQQHTPQPQPNLGQRPPYPQYGGYPPSPGGYPPGGQQSGPPTPPTGFPTYGPPPGQGSSQAPGQLQGHEHHEQAPTQQVPAQPQSQPSSSSPSGPPPSS